MMAHGPVHWINEHEWTFRKSDMRFSDMWSMYNPYIVYYISNIHYHYSDGRV